MITKERLQRSDMKSAGPLLWNPGDSRTPRDLCAALLKRTGILPYPAQYKLTWGNLPTHLNKLEAAGYVSIEKGHQGKKPHTWIHLTEKGRTAFRDYMQNLRQVLDDLPD